MLTNLSVIFSVISKIHRKRDTGVSLFANLTLGKNTLFLKSLLYSKKLNFDSSVETDGFVWTFFPCYDP